MRYIELDANDWKIPRDFYDALLGALGAPAWHGRSLEALVDSMVYGKINAIKAPYRIHTIGTSGVPRGVREEIAAVIRAIKEEQGLGGNIQFQIDP